jgi:uncharacterized phage protein (TIGR01671 family)
MNRQIKFKAYIGTLGKTYDVLHLHAKFPDEDFQRVFINKPLEEGEVKNYRIDGKENHLMQYTGLLDKHGKEIWEGDIIADRYGAEEVVFDDGGFKINETFFSEMSQDKNRLLGFEVIGNVFEHKNLLK